MKEHTEKYSAGGKEALAVPNEDLFDILRTLTPLKFPTVLFTRTTSSVVSETNEQKGEFIKKPFMWQG